MKKNISKLSTNELIELSRVPGVLKSEADHRHVDALMRSHTLYTSGQGRQGGTPDWNRETLIEFISNRNGGISPDQLLDNLHRQAVAPPKPSHAPPTSQPVAPPKPPVAVVVNCPVCSGRTIATEAEAASGVAIFCSRACQERGTDRWQTMQKEIEKFCETMQGRYLECATNDKKMVEYIRDHENMVVDLITLHKAYTALTASGDLLQPLTPQQIREMDDKEFDQRARLEGSYETNSMGGIDLTTFQTKRPEPTVHSSNKTRTFNLPLLGYTGGGR